MHIITLRIYRENKNKHNNNHPHTHTHTPINAIAIPITIIIALKHMARTRKPKKIANKLKKEMNE